MVAVAAVGRWFKSGNEPQARETKRMPRVARQWTAVAKKEAGRSPRSTGGAECRPFLTIAIPLHRSRPFVDVVSANIDAIGREDAEILLSDRTGLDDALEVLTRRHAGDSRIVPIR